VSSESELALGTQWIRVTVGFLMNLIVMEYVLGRRLSWSTIVDGDETGSSVYHGWVITPWTMVVMCYPRRRSKAPFFLDELGRKNPGALYRCHQEWVESFARAAEAEAAKARADLSRLVQGTEILGETHV
jgi:hypothetical protein